MDFVVRNFIALDFIRDKVWMPRELWVDPFPNDYGLWRYLSVRQAQNALFIMNKGRRSEEEDEFVRILGERGYTRQIDRYISESPVNDRHKYMRYLDERTGYTMTTERLKQETAAELAAIMHWIQIFNDGSDEILVKISSIRQKNRMNQVLVGFTRHSLKERLIQRSTSQYKVYSIMMEFIDYLMRRRIMLNTFMDGQTCAIVSERFGTTLIMAASRKGKSTVEFRCITVLDKAENDKLHDIARKFNV
jgi:hypothetical protein